MSRKTFRVVSLKQRVIGPGSTVTYKGNPLVRAIILRPHNYDDPTDPEHDPGWWLRVEQDESGGRDVPREGWMPQRSLELVDDE